MTRRREPPRWSRRGRGTRYRRLSRRRAQRAQGQPPEPKPGGPVELYDAPLADRYAHEEPEKRGLLGMVFGWFAKKPEPLALDAPVLDDGASADEAVRRILLLPRGAARLDAFEDSLSSLAPGSTAHKGVALAFHRELTTLAKNAKVDLLLLKRRVEACAEALLAAGDVERAGLLLSQIGKKRRAAELFVAAGLIDELEAAHDAIDEAQGGRHLSARLAYERFEGLFLVGMRAEALASLAEAIRQWPEHPVYREIAEGFARRVQAHELRLEVETKGERRHVTLVRRFPVVVGRGEGAALRVTSPLVSREHFEIVVEGGRPVARNLVARPVVLDDLPLDKPRALEGEGALDVAGVIVRYRCEGALLWLFAEQQPKTRCAAALAAEVRLPLDDGGAALLLRFADESGRVFALPQGALRVGDETVKRPLLLLEGDRLFVGACRARVIGR